MKKIKIVSFLLILALSISLFAEFTVADDEIKVIFFHQELSFDVPPQLIDGRVMVPARKIFETMGAEVWWNDEAQTVTAVKDDIVIVMQIDNPVISVNGEDITLDVPPRLIDGRTLVPVRAVAEGLNAYVSWEEETQTVYISLPPPEVPPTPLPRNSPPDGSVTVISNGTEYKIKGHFLNGCWDNGNGQLIYGDGIAFFMGIASYLEEAADDLPSIPYDADLQVIITGKNPDYVPSYTIYNDKYEWLSSGSLSFPDEPGKYIVCFNVRWTDGAMQYTENLYCFKAIKA